MHHLMMSCVDLLIFTFVESCKNWWNCHPYFPIKT